VSGANNGKVFEKCQRQGRRRRHCSVISVVVALAIVGSGSCAGSRHRLALEVCHAVFGAVLPGQKLVTNLLQSENPHRTTFA
jgi:hypothetical protein